MEQAESNSEWPLWEVFAQEKTGADHVHCGSVHAPDAELALQNARDVYARRGSVTSLWVAPSDSFCATKPGDEGPFFDPSEDKIYRHPQFYSIPREAKFK